MVTGNIEGLVKKRVDSAQLWLTNKVRDDCRPYVPIKSGRLVNTAEIVKDGKAIKYLRPYAKFQYGGKVMIDPVTLSPFARKGVKKILTNRPLKYSSPTAVAFWFRVVRVEKQSEWIDGVKKMITRGYV